MKISALTRTTKASHLSYSLVSKTTIWMIMLRYHCHETLRLNREQWPKFSI